MLRLSCGRNREIFLAATRNNGSALQYASAELQADREIVAVAIRNDGTALQYASFEWQADRETVLLAVKKDNRAFIHASPELLRDQEIVLTAARHYGRLVPYALSLDDWETVDIIIREKPQAEVNIPKRLRAEYRAWQKRERRTVF
jgi:hypothetical protein